MKSNFILSTFLGLTGVIAPIRMSYVLMRLAHAILLQPFTAGASLCSSSLGTTFTVSKVSGLNKSRLGVVLTCAAMLDDVVGLVMAQIKSNLGGETSLSPVIIIRPILASFVFAVVVPLACKILVKPLARALPSCHFENSQGDSLPRRADQIVFATQAKLYNKCFEKARSVPESSSQPHSASLRCLGTDRINSVGEENSYERQSNPNNSVTGSEINIATNHIYIGHISGLQIWETYYEASLSTF
ncbi:putative sodium hydrogen exchanger family protein [Lachancea thermotolerans]